jgi:hypothetical protein
VIVTFFKNTSLLQHMNHAMVTVTVTAVTFKMRGIQELGHDRDRRGDFCLFQYLSVLQLPRGLKIKFEGFALPKTHGCNLV